MKISKGRMKINKGSSERDKGVYALIIENSRDMEIEIGRSRRKMHFKKGYYAYIGSALSGLRGRIQRHLRKRKKMHWHIDFLLAAESVRIVSVIYGMTTERKECEIASYIARGFDSVKGFGCSDCSCDSHLFFSPDLNTLVSAVRSGFREAGIDAMVMQLNLK